MTDIGDYLREHLLATFFTGEVFAALHLESGEVAAPDYARQSMTLHAPEVGVRSSQNDVTFEASTTWGTITHMTLYDSVEGGNLLLTRELDTPIEVTSGTVLNISAGDFTVYEE